MRRAGPRVPRFADLLQRRMRRHREGPAELRRLRRRLRGRAVLHGQGVLPADAEARLRQRERRGLARSLPGRRRRRDRARRGPGRGLQPAGHGDVRRWSSPAILDQATNQPITGPGTTFVAGGGAFGQKGLGYLDAKALSPLYVVNGPSDDLLIVCCAGVATLVDAAQSGLTAHHDYFAFYVAVDPKVGDARLVRLRVDGAGNGRVRLVLEERRRPESRDLRQGLVRLRMDRRERRRVARRGRHVTLLASPP